MGKLEKLRIQFFGTARERTEKGEIMDKREFEICLKRDDGSLVYPAIVTMEDDTFGVIGNVLALISQLDPGEQVVINCYGD